MCRINSLKIYALFFIIFYFFFLGGGGAGVRWGLGWWGVRVDVNAMLGVGGDVGDVNKE